MKQIKNYLSQPGRMLALFVVCLVAIGACLAGGHAIIGTGMMFSFVPLMTLVKSKGMQIDESLKAFIVLMDEHFEQQMKGLETSVKDAEGLEKKMQDQFDALKEAGATKEELTAQEEILKAQGILINQLKEGEKKSTVQKTFSVALNDAIAEKQSEIDEIIKKNGKQERPLVFSIKAAVTMTSADTIGAGATHFNLTQDTGIISTIRKRVLTYLSNVSEVPIDPTRPYVNWIEELDEQGNPIFIAEGDPKTQLSVKYVEKEKKAKKIAVYGKVTTEMLRYLPRLIAYIQNNMMKRMDIKTEDQLFNGDDTGDNLAGALLYATAFDGGKGTKNGAGLVGLVDNPTYEDVVRAAVLQAVNSYGIPTKFFVDTDILAAMDVAKDSQGRYNIPPFRSADGTKVAGVELVATTALTGTGFDFVGGDLSVLNVGFTQNASVQIGLDGSDFTNNMKTILMEQELVQFVSANDTPVVIKGTMATAKTLIKTP